EVASTMHTHITLDENDTNDIQRIVDLVGGLPLALILATTWLDTLNVAEIAEEIASNLDFLSSDLADMPDRQRSIHAVIEPTWKRLVPKEQRAFLWASIFRGGFTNATFKEMTGASTRTLQTLLNRSLIMHGHNRRYTMHPLLQQYALEKLESLAKFDEAKQAHLRTFLAYAQYHDERRLTGYYLDALTQIAVEQDNLRAGLDWSLAGHDIQDGIALLIAVSQTWVDRSQIKEISYYLEHALTHDANNPELYIRASYCHYRLGNLDIAQEQIQKTIELAHQANDNELLATSYRLLVTVSRELSSEDAIRLCQKSLTYAEKSGSGRAIANTHMLLAMHLSNIAVDGDSVFQHFEKALAYYESVGDIQAISRTVYNMALEHNRQGDDDRARELVEYSLELKKRIGDQAGVARRLSALASWDIMREEFERAEQYLTESLLITEHLGEKQRLRYTLFLQCKLYLIKGEYDKSELALSRSLKIAKEQKNYYWIEICHANLGMLYLLQGKHTQAKDHLLQGIKAIRHTDLNPWASIIVYANYLWFTQQYEKCTSMTVVMSHHIDALDTDYQFMNRYFTRPLIFRVQNHLGDDAWQQVQYELQGITIDEIFQDVLRELDVT
ncbi:MAG: hypothetical protein AAFV93_13490, partial [Chloroflexota bacterium]